MAQGEITVAWLGNFGVLPFWGAGDYPIWPQASDAVKQPHFMNLSQPPTFATKLRYRWGDDTGQYSMLEYDYPPPPPGYQQYFVGLTPPTPPYVELQVQVNIGATVSGGPDMMYWQLLSTAGDFLGYWQADTGAWVAWPDPPAPGRTWTDELLRAPSATWWCVTAVYPLGIDGCPPLPRPPWPYSTPAHAIQLLARTSRRASRSRVAGSRLNARQAIDVAAARLRMAQRQFRPDSVEVIQAEIELNAARARLARQQPVNN
jgi:hypothetical protein